jgi:hypothetical protein
MLQKPSEQIAHCYQRVSECRAKAADAVNEAAAQQYYELERRWLMLRRSYELSERITDFTGELQRRCKVASVSSRLVCDIDGGVSTVTLSLPSLTRMAPHALVFPRARPAWTGSRPKQGRSLTCGPRTGGNGPAKEN